MPIRYVTTSNGPPNGGRVPGQDPPRSRRTEAPPPPYQCRDCAPITNPCYGGPCIPTAPSYYREEATRGAERARPSACECCIPTCTCAHCSVTAFAVKPPNFPRPQQSIAPASCEQRPHLDEEFPTATEIPQGKLLLAPPMITVHVIKRGLMPWLRSRRSPPFHFKAYLVPPTITMDTFIELVFGEKGRATSPSKEKTVVECLERGDGRWERASVWRYMAADTACSLADLGWSSARGTSMKPVWTAWGYGEPPADD